MCLMSFGSISLSLAVCRIPIIFNLLSKNLWRGLLQRYTFHAVLIRWVCLSSMGVNRFPNIGVGVWVKCRAQQQAAFFLFYFRLIWSGVCFPLKYWAGSLLHTVQFPLSPHSLCHSAFILRQFSYFWDKYRKRAGQNETQIDEFALPLFLFGGVVCSHQTLLNHFMAVILTSVLSF